MGGACIRIGAASCPREPCVKGGFGAEFRKCVRETGRLSPEEEPLSVSPAREDD